MVGLSHYSERERRSSCLEAGFHAVLEKPLTEEMIRRHLSPKALASPTPPLDIPCLSTTYSKEGLLEILALYVEVLAKELPELKAIYQENQLETLEELVQRIMGGAMLYKAMPLAEASGDFSHHLRKRGGKGIEMAFQKVCHEMTSLQCFLQGYLEENSGKPECGTKIWPRLQEVILPFRAEGNED